MALQACTAAAFHSAISQNQTLHVVCLPSRQPAGWLHSSPLDGPGRLTGLAELATAVHSCVLILNRHGQGDGVRTGRVGCFPWPAAAVNRRCDDEPLFNVGASLDDLVKDGSLQGRLSREGHHFSGVQVLVNLLQ